VNVTLLASTPDALDVLLFTKNTRLKMSGEGLEDVKNWTLERKAEELRYMRNTIQSSWEFVDYVFAIEGVTRAFTHQLVRHRVGTSFAQQTQRGIVMEEGFEYLATGEPLHPDGGRRSERASYRRDRGGIEGEGGTRNPSNVYDWTMQRIDEGYTLLTELGVDAQDARGVLPTNILTNIVFKANLRTLHDMALKRLCVKTQGEFQDVFIKLINVVIDTHYWAEPFLRVQCAWNGTCLFPSLPVDKCHVKPHVYDPTTAMAYGFPAVAHPSTTEAIYLIHRAKRTEIQPRLPK
jgi:flavin-dependent thymidylate synthase